MSKKHTQRLNEFEPRIKASLSRLENTVDHVTDAEGTFQGTTSVHSVRQTYDVLHPDMPDHGKSLIHAALEQLGLKTFVEAKKSLGRTALPTLRDLLLNNPYSYRFTETESPTHSLQYVDVSIASGSSLPAHQRVKTTYLSLESTQPDEIGALTSTSLNIFKYGSRSRIPEVSLTRDIKTADDIERENLLSDAIETPDIARSVLSQPLSSLAQTSPDAITRGFAQFVSDSRADFEMRQELGLTVATSGEIDELRAEIEALFA